MCPRNDEDRESPDRRPAGRQVDYLSGGSDDIAPAFVVGSTNMAQYWASKYPGPYVTSNSKTILLSLCWFDGMANALTRMESGVATNGSYVYLNGYWKAAPKVMVSPCALQSYDSAYSAQDQTMELSVTNLEQYSTGRWRFKPVAKLILASSSGSYKNVKYQAGGLSATGGTFTTSYYPVPANSGTVYMEADVLWNKNVRYYREPTNDDGTNGSWGRIFYKCYIKARARWRVQGYSSYSVTPWTSSLYFDSPSGSSERSFSVSFNPTTNSPIEVCFEFNVTPQYPIYDRRGVVLLSDSFGDGTSYLEFDRIKYTLDSSTTLAAGTLNYMAIGE